MPGAPVLGRVGSLIERPAFYPYLSAAENLRVFGTAHGLASDVLARRAASRWSASGWPPSRSARSAASRPGCANGWRSPRR